MAQKTTIQNRRTQKSRYKRLRRMNLNHLNYINELNRFTASPSTLRHNGGGKRDRTADLLHAMQALSQLSYTPRAKNQNNSRAR